MAPIPKSSKRRMYRNPKRITVYLPGALLSRMEKRAKAEHRSLNAAIVELMSEVLNK